MNQLSDGLPVHNVALPKGDIEPFSVQIIPDAIEYIRQNVELPEVHEASWVRSREEISAWSPGAQSRAYLRRFEATHDIGDLASAQAHARVLRETRKDGEMATSTIGKKWDRLLAVNLAMKKHFGVIDAHDTEKLRGITDNLGGRVIGEGEMVMSWESQWTKAYRYLALVELTEASEDEESAYIELQTMIDDIKMGKTQGLAGEEPFTVDALYQFGRVEEARELVDAYLTGGRTRSHYMAEPLMTAAAETQDPAELSLALRVVKETLEGLEDGHSKGLRTKYGTQLAELANKLGDTEVAQKAAELISNPQRREQVLGRLAVSQ